MIDCNEWKTEKRHECANMGKVTRLELWWQLYRTSLPVRDLENFTPMDFCWTECTFDGRCCVSERIVLKGLPRQAMTLILTSLDSDHFNASGKIPYIQTTGFLKLKYFPTSGPLLCIRTTSLYSIQRTSLHADRCNSSETLPYIRTTSLHQDHFTTSDPDHFPTSG